MIHKSARMLPLALALAIALPGCAATKAVREVERAAGVATQDRYDAIRTPVRESRSFVVEDGFYAAKRPISVTPVNPSLSLPPAFYEPAPMNVQTPIALSEVAMRIAKSANIPVVIDQDVIKSSSGGNRAAAAPASAAPSALPPLPGAAGEGAATPPAALPPLPALTSTAEQDTILSDVVFRGNLAGLLDEVTSRLNLSWRWNGSRIEIFRYETRMFQLNALAGKVSSSSNLNTTSSTSSGGGGGGGSGGGTSGNQGSSGSTISVSDDLAIWDEVEESLESMLSSDGKISMVPSAGMITVRDTPYVLSQVEAQLAEFNRIYSKQVTLHVEIYSVERSQGDDYGINWNALWQSTSSPLGFSFNAVSGGGAGPAFTIDVTDPNSPFTGSSVVARALSTMGNTTLVQSGTIITLNGQTAPLNVSREEAYVESASTNFNGGGDSSLATTTLTPGVATEGVAMNFTPRILDNNKVQVRYSIDLSTIEAIENFTGGSTTIQLPRRSVRNFMQHVSIPSGDSLVLTGFQQAQGSRGGEGPFSPGAWFLGGNKRADIGSRTIVVVITPYINQ